jgi:hypothetical protein
LLTLAFIRFINVAKFIFVFQDLSIARSSLNSKMTEFLFFGGTGI